MRIETEAASTDVASVEASLLVEAYESLQRLQREMAAKRTASEALALEIADSASFIADLERKREALDDAAVVAEEIDHVHFQYCPSCHAPTETFDHACHLCKTPFDAEQGRRRVAAIITDFEAQLKQSRLLQQRRLARAEKLDDEVLQLARATTAAERNYADISRTPGTEERQLANQLQRKIGYIDRQLEGLEEKLKVAEVIAQLNDQKENLSAEVARLKARNESLNQQQHAKLVNAFSHIADEVRELLRGDVARQDSFTNPQNIDFSFSTNRITVDGNTYFSASSRVILRNSFFVGFFTAATKHASFRHPRFLLMDSIEDKGMEVERAYNFQRMIVARVEAAPSESQVIFGTSMIAPDLDNDHYTVGDRSTQKQRTLKIKNMPERKETQE